eukprot:1160500-Pelagomonas_calceolata.AAC.4
MNTAPRPPGAVHALLERQLCMYDTCFPTYNTLTRCCACGKHWNCNLGEHLVGIPMAILVACERIHVCPCVPMSTRATSTVCKRIHAASLQPLWPASAPMCIHAHPYDTSHKACMDVTGMLCGL